jgi:hypothetical protein
MLTHPCLYTNILGPGSHCADPPVSVHKYIRIRLTLCWPTRANNSTRNHNIRVKILPIFCMFSGKQLLCENCSLSAENINSDMWEGWGIWVQGGPLQPPPPPLSPAGSTLSTSMAYKQHGTQLWSTSTMVFLKNISFLVLSPPAVSLRQKKRFIYFSGIGRGERLKNT